MSASGLGRGRNSGSKAKPAFLTAAVAVLMTIAVFVVSAAGWFPSRSDLGRERIVNGSAARDLTGWRAASQGGSLLLRRAVGVPGAAGTPTTAVDAQRRGGTGTWAFLLAKIAGPRTVFTVGDTYRMQAYVRNLEPPGGFIGMLLGNGNYQHRPTPVSVYQSYHDSGWHLQSRTFVCTSRASADTALYFALPPVGSLHWQVTAASVTEVAASVPTATGPGATATTTSTTAAAAASRSAAPSAGGRAPDSRRPSSGPSVSGPAAPIPAAVPPSRVLGFTGAAGSAPDAAVWNHAVGGGGWGNKEIQTYTDSTANAAADGSGRLVITARRADTTGSDGILRHYTSARLTTEGKVVVQPGSYVEAQVSVPIGTGVWPAFWLLGADSPTVGWPACGEIDVFEAVGMSRSGTTTTIHMAHRTDAGSVASYAGGGSDAPAGASTTSITHVYGVYFDGSVVRLYVDHHQRLVLHASQARRSGWTWPFARPMYIVVNVAVGGPSGDPSKTSFPRSLSMGPISIWDGGVPF